MKAIQLCVTATVLPSFSLSSVAFVMICCHSTLDTFRSRARWRGDFKIMSFLISIASSCFHAEDFKLVVFVTHSKMLSSNAFLWLESAIHTHVDGLLSSELRRALITFKTTHCCLPISRCRPIHQCLSWDILRVITNTSLSLDVVVVVGSFIHFHALSCDFFLSPFNFLSWIFFDEFLLCRDEILWKIIF